MEARAVAALWWREIIRFVRQRSRLVGAFAQPLVFWMLLGGGFTASFSVPFSFVCVVRMRRSCAARAGRRQQKTHLWSYRRWVP